MTDRQTVLLRPSLFRTLFFVAIAAASLVLIDSVLANTERRETALAGARFYRDGERLMQEGKYVDAADAFRYAIANARDNTEYPLALGRALLSAGQFDEAADTLSESLKSDPMAGAPNLAMARIFAQEGRSEEAAFYYHRAIFGQWKNDAPGNRVSARFELADFLAARRSKAELLAELLPLEELAASDAATQERMARLFLIAGSPARAAAIFHDLARNHPGDAEAHEGLGEAELAVGNYAAAQTALASALRLHPGDQKATRELELCERVLNLDPMRKGLNSQERYERSLDVLQRVTDRTMQCLTPANTNLYADMLNAAQAALHRHVEGSAQSDAVEANLELANKVWQAKSTKCASAISADDEPLQLVLAKAAQ